jgi:hypothetical protein
MAEIIISDHVSNVVTEMSLNQLKEKLDDKHAFIKIKSIEGFEYLISKSRIVFVYNSIRRGKKSGEF